MDHTHFTTAGLNQQSSHIQIVEAVKRCTISAMKEYKTTGMIGNTRPNDPQHAYEIAYGLSVEDARRRAGTKAPPFNWDQSKWPEVYRKHHQLPYQFLPDSRMKSIIEKAEDQSVFTLGSPTELLQEVLDEMGEEQAEKEAKEAAALLAGLEPEKPSTNEEIRQGLRDRKRDGPPPPENFVEAHQAAIEEKAEEDLTSMDKIRLGLRDAEESGRVKRHEIHGLGSGRE